MEKLTKKQIKIKEKLGASCAVPFKNLLNLSKRQRKLLKKHGTPADYARLVYSAVPGFISMGEARCSIDKYQKEWDNAG